MRPRVGRENPRVITKHYHGPTAATVLSGGANAICIMNRCELRNEAQPSAVSAWTKVFFASANEDVDLLMVLKVDSDPKLP